MNDLQVFKYQDSEVRTIEMNGEPWFVLKDVCKVLRLTDTGRTAERLDSDELTRTTLVSGGQKDFVAFLLNKKYLYRDKRGRLMPYMDKNNGLFEVKECFNDKTNWAGTQVLITPKGRETFRLLYLQGKKAVRHD